MVQTKQIVRKRTGETNPRRHLATNKWSTSPVHRYPTRNQTIRYQPPKKQPPPKPFAFLKLPAELRNRIYDYVFTAGTYEGRNGVWSINLRNEASVTRMNQNMLAILRTCRKIYDEARHIAIYRNFMSFQEAEELGQFLGRASDRQIFLVNKIEVTLPSFDDRLLEFHHWGMIKLFRNLTTLRLIDNGYESEDFLKEPNHPVAVKVKALRGFGRIPGDACGRRRRERRGNPAYEAAGGSVEAFRHPTKT